MSLTLAKVGENVLVGDADGVVTLSGTSVSGSGSGSKAKGKLVISWDDGWASWWSVLWPMTKRFPDQKHTLFLTTKNIGQPGYITWEQARAFADDGHELAGHSHDHPNMTAIPAADRAADHNQMISEFVANDVPPPRTYAYPYGARSFATDAECYLRYERVFDAYVTQKGHKWGCRLSSTLGQSLVAPRHGFGWPNIADTLELVRLAAVSPVTVHIFSHQPGSDMPESDLLSILQLAHDLGVPVVRAEDSIDKIDTIVNGGFESGTTGWHAVSTGDYVAESIADTPAVGFPGARSLRMNGVSASGSVTVSQFVSCVPGVPHSVSCRARNNTTTGLGKMFLRLQPLNHLFMPIGSPVESDAITSETWVQASCEVTPTIAAEMVRVDLVLNNRQGYAWIDHVHWGPTHCGLLG